MKNKNNMDKLLCDNNLYRKEISAVYYIIFTIHIKRVLIH